MTMSPKQRENLIKAIKANGRMSQESKKKALAKLKAPKEKESAKDKDAVPHSK